MTGEFFFDRPSTPDPKRVELSAVELAQAVDDVQELDQFFGAGSWEWDDGQPFDASGALDRLRRIFERAT